jgi:hypothetical protein
MANYGTKKNGNYAKIMLTIYANNYQAYEA